MSISVTCPQCRSRFNTPENSVGRQGQCPSCGQVFDVRPANRSPTSGRATSSIGTIEQILADAHGRYDSPAVKETALSIGGVGSFFVALVGIPIGFSLGNAFGEFVGVPVFFAWTLGWIAAELVMLDKSTQLELSRKRNAVETAISQLNASFPTDASERQEAVRELMNLETDSGVEAKIRSRWLQSWQSEAVVREDAPAGAPHSSAVVRRVEPQQRESILTTASSDQSELDRLANTWRKQLKRRACFAIGAAMTIRDHAAELCREHAGERVVCTIGHREIGGHGAKYEHGLLVTNCRFIVYEYRGKNGFAWIPVSYEHVVSIQACHGNGTWNVPSGSPGEGEGQLFVEMLNGTTVFADLGKVTRGIASAMIRDFLSQMLVAAGAPHFRPQPHSRFLDPATGEPIAASQYVGPQAAAGSARAAGAASVGGSGGATTVSAAGEASAGGGHAAGLGASPGAGGEAYIPLELPPEGRHVRLEPAGEDGPEGRAEGDSARPPS